MACASFVLPFVFPLSFSLVFLCDHVFRVSRLNFRNVFSSEYCCGIYIFLQFRSSNRKSTPAECNLVYLCPLVSGAQIAA